MSAAWWQMRKKSPHHSQRVRDPLPPEDEEKHLEDGESDEALVECQVEMSFHQGGSTPTKPGPEERPRLSLKSTLIKKLLSSKNRMIST